MQKKKIGIFFVLVVLLFLIFLPGYSTYQVLVQRNNTLKERIRKLELSNQRLMEESKRLREDIVYIEKVLRQRLKMAKKGEIIYKIEPEQDSSKK